MKWRSPVIPPSATPSPPGRSEAEPTNVEEAKMKAAIISSRSGLAELLNGSPRKMTQKARHSPDHERTPNPTPTSSASSCSSR